MGCSNNHEWTFKPDYIDFDMWLFMNGTTLHVEIYLIVLNVDLERCIPYVQIVVCLICILILDILEMFASESDHEDFDKYLISDHLPQLEHLIW